MSKIIINRDRIKKHYIENFEDNNHNMVFYKPNEWYGWRFWLKAVINLDFKSIKHYVKNR